MEENLSRRIKSFRAGDYVRAINSIALTETQINMLRLHYDTPSELATATQLARGMGWSNHGSWNLHYGKLARTIGKELELHSNPGFDWIFILAEFEKPFDGDCRLILRPQVAEAIEALGYIEEDEFLDLDLLQTEAPITEGNPRLRLHQSYERNTVARKKCLDRYGTSCVLCGFDFGDTFGDWAIGFIHVHHLKPLSEIKKQYVIDPVKDLRPVCPNCHAVLHLRKKPFSLEEVRLMLNSNSKGPEPKRNIRA